MSAHVIRAFLLARAAAGDPGAGAALAALEELETVTRGDAPDRRFLTLFRGGLIRLTPEIILALRLLPGESIVADTETMAAERAVTIQASHQWLGWDGESPAPPVIHILDEARQFIRNAIALLDPSVAATEAMTFVGGNYLNALSEIEGGILSGFDDPEERRRIARLPAVSALTRALRVEAARAMGNPHRGLIPGGEDEAAFDAAVQAGQEDPEPVWTNTPVFIGDDWG